MKNSKSLLLLFAAFATGIIYSSGCGGGIESSDVPSNLRVDPASTELLISWEGISGAASYNIYWGTSPDVSKSSPNRIEGVEDTSYVHTGLRNGTTYYYVVTGISDTKESAPSDVADGTPAFSGEKDFEISIPMSARWGDMQLRILSDTDGFIYLMAQKDEEGLFEVYKYNSDGELETDFGNNGKVSHSPAMDTCLLSHMGVNSRQELIILATCGCSDAGCEDEERFTRMYRYLPSGEIDSSFGNSGVTDGSPGYEPGWVKLDENDDILVTGGTAKRFEGHLFLAKYSDAGEELWISDDQDLEVGTEGQSILIDDEGNIIVAQDTGLSLGGDERNRKFIMWKMDEAGTLIENFGTNGRLEPEGYMTGMPMVVDSRNRITTNVNTASMPLDGEARILRYSERGVLDGTFGDGKGKIEMSEACNTDFRNLVAYIGAVEEYGGKFIGGGIGADSGDSVTNLMGFVCIFNEDGNLDTSMFEDGFHYGPPNSFPMGLDIDPLGRMLVSYQVVNSKFMITEIRVLRYK